MLVVGPKLRPFAARIRVRQSQGFRENPVKNYVYFHCVYFHYVFFHRVIFTGFPQGFHSQGFHMVFHMVVHRVFTGFSFTGFPQGFFTGFSHRGSPCGENPVKKTLWIFTGFSRVKKPCAFSLCFHRVFTMFSTMLFSLCFSLTNPGSDELLFKSR